MKWMAKLALFALIVALPMQGLAQNTEADRAKKADTLNYKLRKIDLYNQILPILLKKEQIAKLLPVIEKARKAVKDTEKAELDDMQKLERKLDAALAEAKDKGAVPSREFLKEVVDMYRAFQVRRLEVIGTNTENVTKVLIEVLDAGQKKAVINALDMKAADGSFDTSKMPEDARMRFFVQTILLDSITYDILIELSQKKDG